MFWNVGSWLDREYHARLDLRVDTRRNEKSRIVIAEADVMAGVMGEKRRQSRGCNFVASN
jgi:hypothetical protein